MSADDNDPLPDGVQVLEEPTPEMLAVAEKQTALAKQAGLTVERGIVIGDDLASPDDADIFAVGECAQHRGQVPGA